MILFALLDDRELSGEFEIFVKEYRRLMMAAAMNVLHNYHDAEEAVMDALTSIARSFSKINSFEDRVKRTYVCRSARNRALNILNSQKRQTEYEFPLEDVDESRLAGTFDPLPVTGDDIDLVRECLLKLPEMYRDILYLYYAEEMDTPEIASLLGINKKTVQTRLLRGRNELKKQLLRRGRLK